MWPHMQGQPQAQGLCKGDAGKGKGDAGRGQPGAAGGRRLPGRLLSRVSPAGVVGAGCVAVQPCVQVACIG